MAHRHVESRTPEQPACTEFVPETATSAQNDESDVVDVAWRSIATWYVGRVSVSRGRSRRRWLGHEQTGLE